MNIIYIQIGSNMGDRISYINNSMQQIEDKLGEISNSSKIYESSPWGNINQGNFLNSVIKVESDLDAFKTLKILQEIEENLGRKRIQKWGERCIDLDILFFNNHIIDSKNLTVPHPYIQDRNFVLIPLNEIASTFNHPTLKKDIFALLNDCTDKEEVSIYEI
ncbi:MAG: 2-amino-4-hydroxy-6-hydroxymethyldihydropteridine diphosphokinase [Flavobacteriales bacterium]|nr:2-amino-4-hydroxy-6-hydroxymethyldihydropteridine diphosphokinase [Flavobacteriales bacterium]